MAKEYQGVLLVIACILRSDMGKTLLRKRKFFRKHHMCPGI